MGSTGCSTDLARLVKVLQVFRNEHDGVESTIDLKVEALEPDLSRVYRWESCGHSRLLLDVGSQNFFGNDVIFNLHALQSGGKKHGVYVDPSKRKILAR